ncbi:MAG: hypothetical protein NT075_22665 [Chloroflexi bacterium]|nr:hypothetical protein [Chloroflexota bacterium]
MTELICPPDLLTRPFDLAVTRDMTVPPAVLYRAWTEQFDRWFAAPGSANLHQRMIKI